MLLDFCRDLADDKFQEGITLKSITIFSEVWQISILSSTERLEITGLKL
jgi:hypothetical protein